MQRFWYHSPVRFYRTLDELRDMTNPQNSTFFGSRNPTPLEYNDFHRYLIPNVDNEVIDTELSLWVVDEYTSKKITCVFEIIENRLKYVTFLCNFLISGRLEIRNDAGETLFYSNCVRFVDSTDDMGRKFIRIATKHTYNRNLFDYSSPLNWIITSIPAYCLGMSSVEADMSTSRFGNNSSLKIKETYLDEVVEYEVLSEGDANLLNFIQVHVTNNHFYIDGTQRTCLDKIDRDEFAMQGTLRFTNVKNELGLNIPLVYDDVLSNIFVYVLGNNSKTIMYSDSNYNLIPVK